VVRQFVERPLGGGTDGLREAEVIFIAPRRLRVLECGGTGGWTAVVRMLVPRGRHLFVSAELRADRKKHWLQRMRRKSSVTITSG